ncbi:MAG: bifunctional hydroxymethylpyrimidine kinase/phosphomethylpyrimidine kinase [Candidatus Coatesbacteria bacterium]|nr:bifunctional hydroxymethylpyrimidine kinase/phosphomethylpyrimidine kinase [Candidatus Coatesbacteria bacterium]
MKTALTIAGSDSGGGAGIQADLKTFSAFKVFGTSVITAITAQNTLEVTGIQQINADIVKAQLDAVLEDIFPDAVKTGMLFNEEIVNTVCGVLERTEKHPPLVVDPVMISKSGAILLQNNAIEVVKTRLLPLSRLVTPNIPEAKLLSGIEIRNRDDCKRAAEILLEMGTEAVLIKGGHDSRKIIEDLLFTRNETECFTHERIYSGNTHGTGCTLSAAITACLAIGYNLTESCRKAIDYVHSAIKSAPELGRGHGPLNHFIET